MKIYDISTLLLTFGSLAFCQYTIGAPGTPSPHKPKPNQNQYPISNNSISTNLTMSWGQGIRTVAYFVDWAIYARNHNPQDLPVDHLTHVLYSFANIRPDGEVYLADTWADTDKHYPDDSWNDPGTNVYGCAKQLFKLKQKNRNLKVLLSIGGWTWGANFATPASTSAGRQRFAQTAVKIIEDLGFDGLDLDWEYPQNSAQAQDFVYLLQEVRLELDKAQAKRSYPVNFLLTTACPAGPQYYQTLMVKAMDQYLSFWNLMAYDYAGGWDSKAGHQANWFPKNDGTTPFSTQAALQFYLSSGVPPGKMVIGMPLYGRAFAQTKGIGSSFSGIGEGSWENGVWDYKVLPKSNYQVHNDLDIGASYCYDQGAQTLITYDTPEVVSMKAHLVAKQGLGGGMWWESSADLPIGQGSLIEAFLKASGGFSRLERQQNCLDYPGSKYDNIRNGMK